jgi:hypothetical protein
MHARPPCPCVFHAFLLWCYRIVKLVRAIRKGWLKTSAQKEEAKAPEVRMGNPCGGGPLCVTGVQR